MNRANTNRRVFSTASEVANPTHVQGKDIKPFSIYLKNRQQGLLKHTMRAPNHDPLRQCTFQHGIAKPVEYTNRRVGRPRGKWSCDVLEDLYIINGFGNRQTFRADIANACSQMESSIRNRTI